MKTRQAASAWQLAQLNIARPIHDFESAEMADFVGALDSVNASAELSPGFVWRLESDPEHPEEDCIFGEADWLVNLSVWESPEALLSFVRSGDHLAIMRRRREWFEPQPEATTVLWWVPAGQRPTVREAEQRLEHLRARGPTPHAFGFPNRFPPPG
jgi:hypothetical protein